MPADDEREEFDDGSAGGAIKWSPDNAVQPAAAGSGGPVSWENLFSAPPAPAPQAAAPQPVPAQAAQQDNNPFTNPATAAPPVIRAETPGQPGQPQQPPRPPQQPQQPPQQPQQPPQQPQQPPQQPQQPPQQPQQPPQHPQMSPQGTSSSASYDALNRQPSASSATYDAVSAARQQPTASSAANPAVPSGPPMRQPKGEENGVKIYYTAEDIEQEIAKEQGRAPKFGSPAAAPPPPPQPPQPAPNVPPPSPFTSGPSYPGASGTKTPTVQPPFGQPGPGGAKMPATTAGLFDDEEEEGDGPDLSSVPELETARIWEQRTPKEILHGILKNKKSDYAVALFASTDGEVQGEMLVVKSVIIHGAKLVEPDLSGYEALKVMLTIPHGTYTLLDVTNYVESAQQLEQGLAIRITPLANALPNLPDTVDELMGTGQMKSMRTKEPSDLEAQPAAKRVREKRPKPTLRERLPEPKILALILATVAALIYMLVVLYYR